MWNFEWRIEAALEGQMVGLNLSQRVSHGFTLETSTVPLPAVQRRFFAAVVFEIRLSNMYKISVPLHSFENDLQSYTLGWRNRP